MNSKEDTLDLPGEDPKPEDLEEIELGLDDDEPEDGIVVEE